jgi:carbohydrate kinase (thermoresistant glucokinase family)
MGVSGCGKTTIGELLSKKMNIPFYDADDLHSKVHKEKMRAGLSLTDEDREEWLQKINRVAAEQMQFAGAIIACSALKQKYRAVLADAILKPVWIFLQGSYEMIYQRIENRQGHYMPASLLQSQFNNLEIPADAIYVSIENEPAAIVELICKQLHKT